MPRINDESKSIELPQLTRPGNPGLTATDKARASTKEALSQSTDALTQQVQALVNKMDASDRTLARELAGYVAERPNRFTQMLAAELSAILTPAESNFVDVEVLEESKVNFSSWQAITPSSALGALPM